MHVTTFGTMSSTRGVSSMLAAGGRPYFLAYQPTTGQELWTSDGTARGTRRVADIRPGKEDAQIQDLTASGDRVYFTADDGAHGREPWILNPLGDIAGWVFADVNGNGAREAAGTEPGRAGYRVWIDKDHDGHLDKSELATRSTRNGRFTFTGLMPGTYLVRILPPGAQTITTSAAYVVTVNAGVTAQCRFGVATVPPPAPPAAAASPGTSVFSSAHVRPPALAASASILDRDDIIAVG